MTKMKSIYKILTTSLEATAATVKDTVPHFVSGKALRESIKNEKLERYVE